LNLSPSTHSRGTQTFFLKGSPFGRHDFAQNKRLNFK
jgi:hypothetical protein